MSSRSVGSLCAGEECLDGRKTRSEPSMAPHSQVNEPLFTRSLGHRHKARLILKSFCHARFQASRFHLLFLPSLLAILLSLRAHACLGIVCLFVPSNHPVFCLRPFQDCLRPFPHHTTTNLHSLQTGDSPRLASRN